MLLNSLSKVFGISDINEVLEFIAKNVDVIKFHICVLGRVQFYTRLRTGTSRRPSQLPFVTGHSSHYCAWRSQMPNGIWQGHPDLNGDQRFWRASFYHWTMPLFSNTNSQNYFAVFLQNFNGRRAPWRIFGSPTSIQIWGKSDSRYFTSCLLCALFAFCRFCRIFSTLTSSHRSFVLTCEHSNWYSCKLRTEVWRMVFFLLP